MNRSQAWVELALKTLRCSQKELALRLGVSPTQISKWKSGEHMSLDMAEKFQAVVDIGDDRPEFVLWAGSLADALKWDRLIHFLADQARDSAETGYDTYPLLDELAPGLLCVDVSDALRGMGVEPPKSFPPELDRYFSSDADNDASDVPDNSQLWELLEANAYSAIIRDIFESLNNVWGFYAAYVEDVADDDGGSLYDTKSNIEACLIDLAACKIDVDEKFAPKIRTFRHQVMRDYEEWLTTVKDAAFRAGAPLRAELLDMVAGDTEELGHAAEAESLGFNSTRLHPDIYMNELLVGMRIIHQVLPAILKRLEINDFKVDQSHLHIEMSAPRAKTAASEAQVDPTPESDE